MTFSEEEDRGGLRGGRAEQSKIRGERLRGTRGRGFFNRFRRFANFVSVETRNSPEKRQLGTTVFSFSSLLPRPENLSTLSRQLRDDFEFRYTLFRSTMMVLPLGAKEKKKKLLALISIDLSVLKSRTRLVLFKERRTRTGFILKVKKTK